MKAAAQLSSCIKFNPFSVKWILLYEMAAKEFGAVAEIPRLEGVVMTLILSSRTALMMAESATGWQCRHSIHLDFRKCQQAFLPARIAKERHMRCIKGGPGDFFPLFCTPLEWVIAIFFKYLLPFLIFVFNCYFFLP